MQKFSRSRHPATAFAICLLSACVFNFRNPSTRLESSRDERLTVGSPAVLIQEAPLIEFPGNTSSNSPAHWDAGMLYVFNSAPDPWRSFGPDLFNLGQLSAANYDNEVNGKRWIEATFKDVDGILYGWYHNEPQGVCANKEKLTAPRIGAMRSEDNGANWQDLGIILESSTDSLSCSTQNYYNASGHGDNSVILDSNHEYFYFFFSSYNGDLREQGVSVARMRYPDRQKPIGKVWKWHKESWSEPGIGGHVTPIIPTAIDWHLENADSWWGPSIHWNTHLEMYVLLLNHAINANWEQEGVYVSFNRTLDKPEAWSPPRKVLDRKQIFDVPKISNGRYPQVMGLEKARGETDKLAGQRARLFVHGKSRWEIVFLKPGEKP